LRIRHDHGSQYMSDHFQQELRFLGMESSPAFVRGPEGNGCIERFLRTLKEQLLWVRHFQDLEELELALRELRDGYNREGLIERFRLQSPRQARERLLALQQAA
jgi:transposase InsO family protein